MTSKKKRSKLLVVLGVGTVLLMVIPFVLVVLISSSMPRPQGCGPADVLTPGTDPLSDPVLPVSYEDDLAAQPVVAGAADVRPQLLEVDLGTSRMTVEQATNAVAIAQVARELKVMRFGLEIAIATALQESGLRNLSYGDADSQGLFQQRPSSGWGTVEQITNPRRAAQAFFGRASHTSNPGLLDVAGWQRMTLTEAAATVQRPRADLRGEYAKWTEAAEAIAGVLGGDLPDVVEPASAECLEAGAGSYTVATLNLLGAGHDRRGFPRWDVRLPRALETLKARGVTAAGIQEVHAEQADALAKKYSTEWGMFPKRGAAQNRVVWDPAVWQMTDNRFVTLPYFNRDPVQTPLVQLTSTTTGEAIWVWSIHNPAGNGVYNDIRDEAVRIQLDVMTELKATGAPAFLAGDFNDNHPDQGERPAHCILTPTLINVFGPGRSGDSGSCAEPKGVANVDHIFATNVQIASAEVDYSTEERRISDHPLVLATTQGAQAGCPPTGSPAEEGLTPDALMVLRSVNANFGPHAYGGIGNRPNASDHPAGKAVDIMIEGWDTPAGKAEGDRIAAWVIQHAAELGLTYVIWADRIRNAGDSAWRPYTHPNGPTANATLRHLDHVHVSVDGDAGTGTCGDSLSGRVVYPVPVNLIGSDRRNWGERSPLRQSWHTGTDFSVPRGTPILAAHGGTIRLITRPSWYGRWLVMITTGPDTLATWYAHLSSIDVTDGQQVAAGQPIGAAGGDRPEDGNSTGSHLHFEVHLKNGPIYGADNTNPTTWLAEQTRKTRT